MHENSVVQCSRRANHRGTIQEFRKSRDFWLFQAATGAYTVAFLPCQGSTWRDKTRSTWRGQGSNSPLQRQHSMVRFSWTSSPTSPIWKDMTEHRDGIYEHPCPGMNLLSIDHVMIHTMVSFPAGYTLHTPLCLPDTVAISPKSVHTSTTLEGRVRGPPNPTSPPRVYSNHDLQSLRDINPSSLTLERLRARRRGRRLGPLGPQGLVRVVKIHGDAQEAHVDVGLVGQIP